MTITRIPSVDDGEREQGATAAFEKDARAKVQIQFGLSRKGR